MSSQTDKITVHHVNGSDVIEDEAALRLQVLSEEEGKEHIELAIAETSKPGEAMPISHEEALAQDKNTAERVVREIDQLQGVFELLGFRLAEQSWLGFSVGSSLGFRIKLQPLSPDQLDAILKKRKEKGEDTDPDAIDLLLTRAQETHTRLQQAAVAAMRRARDVGAELEATDFVLSSVELRLAGFGLAIPSATVRLNLGDYGRIEKVNKTEDTALAKAHKIAEKSTQSTFPDHGKEEQGEKKKHHGISGFFSKMKGAFSKKHPKSLARQLCRDLRGLRHHLAQDGLLLGEKPGDVWLTLVIGTFVGANITVTPSPEVLTMDPRIKAPELSAFQRGVLASLRAAFNTATKLTGHKLAVSSATLTLSGLGLAIPRLSTTLSFRDAVANDHHRVPEQKLYASKMAQPLGSESSVSSMSSMSSMSSAQSNFSSQQQQQQQTGVNPNFSRESSTIDSSSNNNNNNNKIKDYNEDNKNSMKDVNSSSSPSSHQHTSDHLHKVGEGTVIINTSNSKSAESPDMTGSFAPVKDSHNNVVGAAADILLVDDHEKKHLHSKDHADSKLHNVGDGTIFIEPSSNDSEKPEITGNFAPVKDSHCNIVGAAANIVLLDDNNNNNNNNNSNSNSNSNNTNITQSDYNSTNNDNNISKDHGNTKLSKPKSTTDGEFDSNESDSFKSAKSTSSSASSNLQKVVQEMNESLNLNNTSDADLAAEAKGLSQTSDEINPNTTTTTPASFILGFVSSASAGATNMARLVSGASWKALTATGEAASRVLDVTAVNLEAAGSRIRDLSLKPARIVMDRAHNMRETTEKKMNVRRSHEWISLTLGTVFGVTLSFEPMQYQTNQTEGLLNKQKQQQQQQQQQQNDTSTTTNTITSCSSSSLPQDKGDQNDQKQDDSAAISYLEKALEMVSESSALKRGAGSRLMPVRSLSLYVGGFGLGIPEAAGIVYMG